MVHKTITAIAAALTLCGCASKVITKDVPRVVSVAVTQPCAAIRPERPEPLPDSSHWAQYDVRQKAAALGAYAIRLRDYSEALDAATSGCL